MFIRAKRSVQNGRTYEYLQIVESYREKGKVRQRVIANLGRRENLVAEGKVDALLRSLAKFSEKLKVVERVRSHGLEAHTARSWGAALVFGRLWQEQGLPEVIRRLAKPRRFGFDIERSCFAMALQRLCNPGSDLQGIGWLQTVEAPGFDRIELHHLYRTAGFLYDVREDLERELFFRDRDLFNQELDLVFIDTTSTFIWTEVETELRRRGYSRDRRPDQPQLVLCVAVDRRGWPVAWDVLPGNTADCKAMVKMIEKLRRRFNIRRTVVVADRGMIARGTIELLEGSAEAPFDYILGCRMRKQSEVNEKVLGRAGRFHTVADNLEVKEVVVGGRRYVVCRNPQEAKKDAEARRRIIEHLEKLLKHGPKTVIRNKGFSRFLKVSKGAVSIDHDAVRADARLDGKFVLRTNTELPADEVALAYKSLWRVERTFREAKSTLEVRPIFHHRDDTSVGHIVGCFLALRLEVDLQRRLDERKVEVSWPDLMRDLEQVKAVEVTLDGNRYLLRTDMIGKSYEAFVAAGVRPPPKVTPLAPPGNLARA